MKPVLFMGHLKKSQYNVPSPQKKIQICTPNDLVTITIHARTERLPER